MAIPTVALSESTPDGNDSINGGDNRIREYKTQNREILEVDHDYPSSGNSDTAGQHKKVTLQEQEDIGSGASGVPIFGAQTDAAGSGKPEACFTDEDDNDVFVTDNGRLGNRNIPIIASMIDAVGGLYDNGVNILNKIYPVGIVVTLGVSTNPNTLFGIGTWTAIAGKVIVGIDVTQTEFDTLDETGGAKTVTLDTTMIPSHSHQVTIGGKLAYVATGGTGWNVADDSSSNGGKDQMVTDSTGGGLAHNNLQPYIVKYVWQRVS